MARHPAQSQRPILSLALPALLAMLLAVGAAPAAALAEEQWLVLLRSQIKDSHNCAIQHIVFVREIPVGKETTIEGRLRCIDGREYDFSRPRAHQKYEIRLCQPTIC